MAQVILNRVIFKITGGPKTEEPLTKSFESRADRKILVPFQTNGGIIKALVTSMTKKKNGKLSMTCDCVTERGAVKENAKVVYSLTSHTGTIKGFAYK